MADKVLLNRFTRAMTAVYGPFDTLSLSDMASWSPPEDPGAGGHRGRYLWTDAFGVLNFLTLAQETLSSLEYLALAKRLVHTVHEVLGRVRDGTARLPGATDDEPLAGGLRIGKVDAGGPDGDGQYHHYLTLWMFALNRLSLAAREPLYNDLAVQLARAIHPHFVFSRSSSSRSSLRMVWKISTDMRRVLVPSQGHLDAATGYVVYKLLQQTVAHQHPSPSDNLPPTPLQNEIADYALVMSQQGEQTPSRDFLDLGMGLWVCHLCRVDEEPWAAGFIEQALVLAQDMLSPESRALNREASRRLAFREFGTCLGIACVVEPGHDLMTRVASLLEFWESRMLRSTEDDLRPISLVMYAAALIPGAFRREFPDA